MFYDGDLKGAWQEGRYSAEINLKGVHRFFVKLGTPAFLISRASALMPTNYRPSAMKTVVNVKGRALLHITEFGEPDDYLEHALMGYIEHALEINGCGSVRLQRLQSLTKGNAVTEIEATW